MLLWSYIYDIGIINGLKKKWSKKEMKWKNFKKDIHIYTVKNNGNNLFIDIIFKGKKEINYSIHLKS